MFSSAAMLGERFSRREVAFGNPVWFALTGAFAFFTVAVAVIALAVPGVNQPRLLVLATLLAAFTFALTVMPRPTYDSAQSHVVLSSVYIGPALAMVGFAPHGSSVIASAMFVGPLVSVWVDDRRKIVAHLVAATIVMVLPGVVGIVDTGTLAASLRLVPSIWLLALLCTLVLEAAEIQARELERLVRRDPLTGIGNRRLLNERLADELETHARASQTLSMLTLDLDGFKQLNDTLGHAAGDELLRTVARTLTRAVRPYDTVARQGGDEFAVLLPETTPAQAQRVVTDIRHALAAIEATTSGVCTGIGLAAFPNDGADAESLLAAADERLRADKHHRSKDLRSDQISRQSLKPAGQASAQAPSPTSHHHESLPFGDGISRRQLAGHRWIWLATGVMYIVNAGMAYLLMRRVPELTSDLLPYVIGGGLLIGVVTLATRPPAIGTRFNHLAIALAYITPLATLVACQPGGSIGIGSSIFIGPVAAARLINRREISAHLAFASVLFLSLIPAGLIDATTSLAVLLLVASFWLLGACIAVVLEAAEAQGDELEQLVRRDPLTGAYNRRKLDEWLGDQLARHARTGRPLAVVALDLNGFKALNDTAGHAAGDALLVEVAGVLAAQAPADALVVRQGGDEFCVAIPGFSAPQAQGWARQLRVALAEIDCGGHALSTGIGVAVASDDATTAFGLLDAADRRLLVDKPPRPAAGGTAANRRALGAVTAANGLRPFVN